MNDGEKYNNHVPSGQDNLVYCVLKTNITLSKLNPNMYTGHIFKPSSETMQHIVLPCKTLHIFCIRI